MKRNSFVKLLAASFVFFTLQNVSAQDWPEQERIDRSFRLAAGARVEVSTIYGPVDIETSDTDSAEVHIIRYARSSQDLMTRKISIEQTATGLAVRGEKDQSQEPRKVKHRVTLRIPRKVELSVESVNGYLNVGEVDGAIRIHRVNGAVRVDRAGGYADVSRVNGSLRMALALLVPLNLNIQQVNGAVDLRFSTAIDADLSIAEFNGAVNVTMPNTSVLHKSEHQTFRARIGSGGAPISISDVNGSITLAPLS